LAGRRTRDVSQACPNESRLHAFVGVNFPSRFCSEFPSLSDHRERMGGWRHSGFNVYAGPRIHPRQKRSVENLAAYLIRSSFSQQRMEYLPDQAKVAYRSKDGKEKKTYDALDWRRATSPNCLPPTGSVDTACEAALIRLPLRAPVCPKSPFLALPSGSTRDRSAGPWSLLFSHAVPHAAGHNIWDVFLFDTQFPSVVFCSYPKQVSCQLSIPRPSSGRRC